MREGWFGLWMGWGAMSIAWVGAGAQTIPVEADAPNFSSRYVQVVPLPGQDVSLMRQRVGLWFPVSVQTVGHALDYALHFSGYQWVPWRDVAPTDAAWIRQRLDKPLPWVDRHLPVMPLNALLQRLMGAPFVLQVDELRRAITFVRAPPLLQEETK